MTNRNRAVIWVLAVFLLGAFSGGMLVYLLVLPSSATPLRGERPDFRDPKVREEAMKRLSQELMLTAEQETQVAEILEQARVESQQIMHQTREQTHERLRVVLTPEQMDRFEKYMKHEKGRRGGGGRPPGK
jgi:Spy/CpxP family protein refolding chaperone